MSIEPEVITVPELAAAIADKFVVVGTHCPCILNSIVGDFKFINLTLEEAEKLVESGFMFLERKAQQLIAPRPVTFLKPPAEILE